MMVKVGIYKPRREDRGWVPISQRKNWEGGGRVPVEESHVWPQYSSYLFGGWHNVETLQRYARWDSTV